MSFHFGYWTVIDDNRHTVTSPAVAPEVTEDEVPFDLDNDTTLRIGGVLTFNADAVTPNNLTYSMDINNRAVIINRVVDSTVFHSEQEAITQLPGRPLVLKHGENKLLIKITGGTGTLRISDIVLHYVRLS